MTRDQLEIIKETQKHFKGFPPLVTDLLSHYRKWGNIYLKAPQFDDIEYSIPQPAVILSDENKYDSYYLYPENLYLIKIMEFLNACILKANELLSKKSNYQEQESIRIKLNQIIQFKENLSFITIEDFNEIIDIYASRIVDILQSKTVFFYEQKARSERYLIVRTMAKVIEKIESLNIDSEGKSSN